MQRWSKIFGDNILLNWFSTVTVQSLEIKGFYKTLLYKSFMDIFRLKDEKWIKILSRISVLETSLYMIIFVQDILYNVYHYD